MLLGLGLLPAAGGFLGLFPTTFLTLFDPLTQQLTGWQLSEKLTLANGLVLGNTQPQGGTVSTAGILLMGVCLLPVPLGLWFFFAGGTKVRIGPTWDCGLKGLTPTMEYTATGFSKPIRMIFKALFRPRREVQRKSHSPPYSPKPLRSESHLKEPFVPRLSRPLTRMILRFPRRM